MDCKRVNYDRDSLLSGHVAETLNQDQINDRLMITETGVNRNVYIVGLHWNLGRHGTVKWRDRCRLQVAAH